MIFKVKFCSIVIFILINTTSLSQRIMALKLTYAPMNINKMKFKLVRNLPFMLRLNRIYNQSHQ